MTLRTEISDRLAMTTEHDKLRNLYETSIYQITETNLLWLSRHTKVGIEKATKLHNSTVAKIADEGKIHYCSCGEIARQYSRIANEWICSECWDINVGERN
jgi:hypothetical protein